jgi:hypothetical protein
MGIGDWGLGIGDWGLGIGPNPQSPIPKSPFDYIILYFYTNFYLIIDLLRIVNYISILYF